MTPFLSQVLNPPGNSGLVKTEKSKGAQLIEKVHDVTENEFPVAGFQDHKEFVKALYECEVWKSPAEASTTTPIISERDLKSELRGQISEASEKRHGQSLTHEGSLETVVIVEEPCCGLHVQTGDSTVPIQVRESVQTLTGREFIAETNAATKSSAVTLAMEPRKQREEVETGQMLLTEDLKDRDTEHFSSLSLVESTKVEEKRKECSAVSENSSQNTKEAEIEVETCKESKRDRSPPQEKTYRTVQEHEVTEKLKPGFVTDTELKNTRKVQAIKPQNSLTDIELKHHKITEIVLPLVKCEEESKKSRGPQKSREPKESRETKELGNISEIKKSEESREATDTREPEEAGDPGETSETRLFREPKEPKETSAFKETREPFKTRVLKKSKETNGTRQIREPSRAGDLEESMKTKELTESIAVSPQRGEVPKTEEIFFRTESTEKRRITLKIRGTETTSITIAICKLSLDSEFRSYCTLKLSQQGSLLSP